MLPLPTGTDFYEVFAFMTGKERVNRSMRHEEVDRTPVFCQLSLGHYMINTSFEPYMIWFSPETFADSLVMLADRYNFDGILVNLPGRCRDWKKHIVDIVRKDGKTVIHWDDSSYSICPDDDNVHHFRTDKLPIFDEVDPDLLYYIEPHDVTGIKYPYYYGFRKEYRPHDERFFPDYILDTLKAVINKSEGYFHISSEIFSPFTQIMELFGYTEALMALIDNPVKCEKILEKLALGTATLAKLQSTVEIDAVLISSAFAGGGFISREHYKRFVLPYEKYVVEELHRICSLPIYVHTCGAIGDRIDLMVEAGYDGIDTMDPPPLGNTDIAEVKKKFGEVLFLKGNLDPVNIMLKGTKDQVYNEARRLIRVAGYNSGYILSTACSISPKADPENIKMLYKASIDLI